MKKETYEKKYNKLKEELKQQRKEDLLARGYRKRKANNIINNATHIYGFKLYNNFDDMEEEEYKEAYQRMKQITSLKWRKDKMIAYLNNWKSAIEDEYILQFSKYAEDKLEEKRRFKDAQQLFKVVNDLKRIVNKAFKSGDDQTFFKVWNTLTSTKNVKFTNLYLGQIYTISGSEEIDGITLRNHKDVFEYYVKKWTQYIKTIDKSYNGGKK